ncbi:MAG: TonB family protein [Candidatus Dadabacteria bacterium]|nr:MAG: TonB family protein [Candidatus Dadabacteria bacterium]
MSRWLLLISLLSVAAVSRDQVSRRIEADQPLLQLCYESVLAVDPELEGRALVRFDIGRDGRVAQVGVTGPAADPALTACVADLVGQWRFKPQDEPTTVELPLRFRPKTASATPRPAEPMSPHTVLLLLALLAIVLVMLLVRIAATGGEHPDPPDRTGE